MIEGCQVFGHRLKGRSLRSHGFIHIITEIVHTVSLDTHFVASRRHARRQVIDTIDARSHDGHFQALAAKGFHQSGQVFIHFFQSNESSGANRSPLCHQSPFFGWFEPSLQKRDSGGISRRHRPPAQAGSQPHRKPFEILAKKAPEQTKLKKDRRGCKPFNEFMVERIICSKVSPSPIRSGNTNKTGRIARCRGLDRGDGMEDDECTV